MGMMGPDASQIIRLQFQAYRGFVTGQFITSPTNLVDLTHSYAADTIYWPTDTQGFVLENLAAGVTDAGFYYAANRFSTAEHGGTHIDAPIHFAEGRPTVDAIPLERLVGPGVVVDVSDRALADRDYRVSVADFEAWEARHGALPDGAIVLLRTGYGQRWPDRAGYLGTASTGPEAVADAAPSANRMLMAGQAAREMPVRRTSSPPEKGLAKVAKV